MHKSNLVIDAFYCPRGWRSYYHHIQIIQILGLYFWKILCIVTLNFCDLEKEDVDHTRAIRHNEVLGVGYPLELDCWEVEIFKDFGLPPNISNLDVSRLHFIALGKSFPMSYQTPQLELIWLLKMPKLQNCW